ncbi:Y-family DNA polymerase [Methyloceanibacter methanicus]|uniref:Y-family DNA polymerase n=1 Tax=Methyloceanibacter methanicus TaxID=1774968 RepID=UPI0008496FBA|nr:DNA polymerase Y family protein [Methyloceanibacter methanicus]
MRERLQAGRTPPPARTPFALVGSDAHGLALTAVNTPCRQEGLSPGMRLADAKAICPALLTVPGAPDKDAAFLESLARWASRYSPSLNVDGTDGLWLDTTGVAPLFGGEPELLADLATRLARLGLSARLGCADTLGSAWALARFARRSPAIAASDALPETLAPFPIEALRLEPETVLLLQRLGLKRIGQLYDLPRASLEPRFHSKDAAESVLHRLDEALGARNEKHAPLLPAPDFVARLSFAEPLISHDGVLASLERLAGDLCGMLTRAGTGARRVVLWAARTDGSSAAIEAGLSAPSATPSHLVRLLKEKLETIDMGFGVDLMILAALAVDDLYPEQTGLSATTRKPGPEKLIDALSSRLGARMVRRLFPQESHIPELAQTTRSAFAKLPAWNGNPQEKPPRPPLLLAKPESVAVMAEIPEGPPARFTWRRVSRRVVKAEGPERIAPEWWRAFDGGTPQRTRDYYRIEDEDGCRYWVFREGLYQERGEQEGEPPRWFLHGVFP